MIYLIVGLVIFLGMHSVEIFSPTFRGRTVARIGEGAYKGIYSLLSIAGFVLLVWGYGVARQEPILVYAPPVWTRHLTALLMLPVFPLLLAAYLAWPYQGGGETSDARGDQDLGASRICSPMACWPTAVVRRLSGLGGGRPHFLEASPVVRPVPGPPPMKYNDLIAVVGGLALYVIFVLWLHVR